MALKHLSENSLLPKKRPVSSASAQLVEGISLSTTLRGVSLDTAAARISHGAEMRAILTLALLVVSLKGAVPEVKYQDQLAVKGDRSALYDLSLNLHTA